MDFDQMLETWQAQTPCDVNRDALRLAIETEEARFRRELRMQRRALWFAWIFGTGMAVFAAFGSRSRSPTVGLPSTPSHPE
jgi:hypothetical protein